MPRQMSFSKTIGPFLRGEKTVTRRLGWLFLRADDLFEAIEHSFRNGPGRYCGDCDRFFCESRLGPVETAGDGCIVQHGACPQCSRNLARNGKARMPRILGLCRVVSVRREPLSAITRRDVAREGFPGLSPRGFMQLFSGERKPDPSIMVTRIEFERYEPGEGDECVSAKCAGSYVVVPAEDGCYCHATMPPCSNCTSSTLECSRCGREDSHR